MRACAMILACVACVVGCGTDDDGMSGPDDPSPECLEVASTVFRTRFEGAGFVAFDNRILHVVTTIDSIGGIECRAAGRDVVIDGAFEARSDNRRDDAVYPRLGAWVDVNADGTCTAETDPVWTIVSVIVTPPGVEDTQTLTTEDFAIRTSAEGCDLVR